MGERAGKELHTQKDTSGRKYIVVVGDDGRRTNSSVAALVLLAHVGRPKADATRAIHGAKGVGCDDVTNLRWGTQSEQMQAAREQGRMVGFGKTKKVEVTEAMARTARDAIKSGTATLRGWAAEHKVPRTSLTYAINRLRRRRSAAA
jgi:hypothetical protein